MAGGGKYRQARTAAATPMANTGSCQYVRRGREAGAGSVAMGGVLGRRRDDPGRVVPDGGAGGQGQVRARLLLLGLRGFDFELVERDGVGLIRAVLREEREGDGFVREGF